MSAVTLEGPVGKKKAYRVRWRYNGQRPRKSLGTVSEAEAQRRRDEIGETLRLLESGRLEVPTGIDAIEFVFSAGRIAQARAASRQTLQAAIDAYLGARKGRITAETFSEYERRLNAVCDRLGGPARVIDSIELCDLQRFVERRQQEVSGDSVKRDLTRFFDMYKFAAASGWITRPLDREQVMTILKPTIKRDKKKPAWRTYGETLRQIKRRNLSANQQKELWKRAYFDETELARFFDDLRDATCNSPGFVYPMVVAAMFTGARRSELCRMEIQDVDLDHGVFTIRQRKADRDYSESERIVPIHGQLAAALELWLIEHPGGKALFRVPGNMARSWPKSESPRDVTVHMASDHLERVVRNMTAWKHVAGRWHLFRHSFISWCAVSGVPEADIESWVGHLTPEMRKHYTHLSIDRKKSQMGRLELPIAETVI